jgi:hypothetical protein
LASILVPFWKPFVIKFNVSGRSFYVRFLGLECYWFWSKKPPGNSPRNLSFCLFVRPCCAGWIFDASLAQLGSLLGPFWSPVGSILLVWNIFLITLIFISLNIRKMFLIRESQDEVVCAPQGALIALEDHCKRRQKQVHSVFHPFRMCLLCACALGFTSGDDSGRCV